MNGRLYIDFCGEEHTLNAGDRLSFGRSGDLVVDDNPYLHRVVGVFAERSGSWWLHHVGERTTLTLRDLNAASVTTLAPGGAIGIHGGDFAVGFSAGPTTYELLGALEAHEWDTDLFGPHGTATMRTLDWGRVELNPEQRLLLTAMCESHLEDPTAVDIAVPTNKMLAQRLGWTLPKVNRKLDHLAEKLHRCGIQGVVGGPGGAAATERRKNVVEHGIRSQLVTRNDLDLLDRAVPAA